MIKKFDDEELDPAFLKRSEAYRQDLIEREFLTEGKRGSTVRRTSYYEIPMLSYPLIQEILTFIKQDKALGVKVKGRKAKQVLHTHGESKAKSVLPQGVFEDNKLEKRFIKALEKAIENLLSKQGYFTEKQLVSAIDPKQKLPLAIKQKGADGKDVVIKTARQRKEEWLAVYLPSLILKKELTKATVNKETRQSFQIPASINSSTVFYY